MSDENIKDIKFGLDLDKFIERTDDLCIGHLQNEIEWFKSRMDAYTKSFFKVCDIVEHSDAPDIIKKLVKEEKDRYWGGNDLPPLLMYII